MAEAKTLSSEKKLDMSLDDLIAQDNANNSNSGFNRGGGGGPFRNRNGGGALANQQGGRRNQGAGGGANQRQGPYSMPRSSPGGFRDAVGRDYLLESGGGGYYKAGGGAGGGGYRGGQGVGGGPSSSYVSHIYTVKVKGLPLNVSEKELENLLRRHFSVCGNVVKVVFRPKFPGEAYIGFQESAACGKALAELQESKIRGHVLTIEKGQPQTGFPIDPHHRYLRGAGGGGGAAYPQRGGGMVVTSSSSMVPYHHQFPPPPHQTSSPSPLSSSSSPAAAAHHHHVIAPPPYPHGGQGHFSSQHHHYNHHHTGGGGGNYITPGGAGGFPRGAAGFVAAPGGGNTSGVYTGAGRPAGDSSNSTTFTNGTSGGDYYYHAGSTVAGGSTGGSSSAFTAPTSHGPALVGKQASPGSGTTIIISNVPLDLTAQELQDAFSVVGPVLRTELLLNSSGSPTGRVALTFESRHAALEAVRRFDGGDLNAHTIRVFLE